MTEYSVQLLVGTGFKSVIKTTNTHNKLETVAELGKERSSELNKRKEAGNPASYSKL